MIMVSACAKEQGWVAPLGKQLGENLVAVNGTKGVTQEDECIALGKVALAPGLINRRTSGKSMASVHAEGSAF